MDYSMIYKRTRDYVTDLFEQHRNPALIFHNLRHTEYVVSKVKEISAHYELNDEDMLVVFLAAWFHDTGYLQGEASGHEAKSVELMKAFMEEYDMPETLTKEVASCIMATMLKAEPQGLIQEILCDADTFNFGTEDFKITNMLVYQEWHNINPDLTKDDFNKGALEMLKRHTYYTSYCKHLLNADKKKNMKKLEKKLDKQAEKVKAYDKIDLPENLSITEKEGTTKGMQTMLRLTSSNHIQLSEMADSKANILISVNAIIISVILSVLLRKLQTDPYLTIPTMIFLTATVVTIVIAILATRPKVNVGTFNEEDVRNKKTNLLFFGNFHKMSLSEYEGAMRMMMRDADYLYSSMVQDIYHLGTVLGRKYKLIRLAYTIFMVGIVVSVIAFAIASVYNVPSPAAIPTNKTGDSPF